VRWDGADAYGRQVYGAHDALIRIGYIYPAQYYEPSDFESSFADYPEGTQFALETETEEVTVWSEWTTTLYNGTTVTPALGGWSLDVHHVYDPEGTLWQGDGTIRSAKARTAGRVITTVAGNGDKSPAEDGDPASAVSLAPLDLAFDAAGGLYVPDAFAYRVYRIDPAGMISIFAGNGVEGVCGDGGPATEACLDDPREVAVDPDGGIDHGPTSTTRRAGSSPGSTAWAARPRFSTTTRGGWRSCSPRAAGSTSTPATRRGTPPSG
jgi:hypothetical protein